MPPDALAWVLGFAARLGTWRAPGGARRDRAAMIAAKALGLWPERLGRTPWRDRIRCEGWERLERARAAGGVLLATLHFGPMRSLVNWLRARGVPVAALVSRGAAPRRSALRRRLDAVADRATGLAEVPRFFDVETLWDAQEFLRGGGVLFVTLDAPSKHRVEVEADGLRAGLAPGALRLAHVSDAGVLPVLMAAEPWLCGAVHFGEPVPRDLVADRRHHEDALTRIFRDLLPALREHPGQWRQFLLDAVGQR
jgi:lauroyl/myristoyl acyltransferase